MSREETKQAIKVMQAYVDGAEIERLELSNKWTATSAPRWDWIHYPYRIKQTTKPSIDWSHVAPEYKWLTRSRSGHGYLFYRQPKHDRKYWDGVSTSNSIYANNFASYAPGDCHWEDSLVRRPDDE
jgi:hypothetical protein